MNQIQNQLTQPLPQNTHNQDERARGCLDTLYDLIKKICETVATFFMDLFSCCRPTSDDRLPSGLHIYSPTHLSNNPLPSQQLAFEVLQNSTTASTLLQTTNEDLALRSNQVAKEALMQVANAYADYLQHPIEPVMRQYSRVFTSTTGKLADRLVGPYLGGIFAMVNADMRYGATEMARLLSNSGWSWLGPLKDLENVERKVYIAHLQQAISNSSDRITENENAKKDCTVHRISRFAQNFIKEHLTPEKIEEGIFLTNKSFLSTSSKWIPKCATGTALEPLDPAKYAELRIRIQLTPNTPIFDVLKHPVYGFPSEFEILLPAGRAFQVRSYNPATLNLDLEEVSPDSIYGTLHTNAL